jgi:hypothetical protein
MYEATEYTEFVASSRLKQKIRGDSLTNPMTRVRKEKLACFKLKPLSKQGQKSAKGLDCNLQFRVYVLRVVKE